VSNRDASSRLDGPHFGAAPCSPLTRGVRGGGIGDPNGQAAALAAARNGRWLPTPSAPPLRGAARAGGMRGVRGVMDAPYRFSLSPLSACLPHQPHADVRTDQRAEEDSTSSPPASVSHTIAHNRLLCAAIALCRRATWTTACLTHPTRKLSQSRSISPTICRALRRPERPHRSSSSTNTSPFPALPN
jgi:hypothetical protein